MTSANGLYKYSDEYDGVTLDFLVETIHKEMSTHYKWKYYPLKHGSFGYENMINSIGKVLTNKKKNKSIDETANLIHESWIDNYTFWRDTKPFLTNNKYIKPATTLGDDRRNECAKTKYSNLPNEEKEKDIFMARILYNLIETTSKE